MTAFTDIYDRALVTMQDYTLDKLAETNYDAFLLFMKSLLKSGIPFFNCCLNSLEFEDIEETEIDEDGNESQVTNTYFVADLTNKEQSILAMVLAVASAIWLIILLWLNDPRIFQTMRLQNTDISKLENIDGIVDRYNQNGQNVIKFNSTIISQDEIISILGVKDEKLR